MRSTELHLDPVIERRLNTRTLLLPMGILCAVALRLVNLQRGYSGDEAVLIAEAGQPVADLIAYLRQTSVYPPLTPLLLKAWMLLDNHEAWIRSYFVLNGTVLCLVLYGIGKHLGGRAVGLACLFAAAVSPMLVWASQFVRPYGDSALWTVLAVYCLLRAADSKEPKWWAGYALSALIAFYMFYYTALVVGAFSVGMLFACREKIGLRRWLAVHVLIVVAVAPWLGIAYQQVGENATGRVPYWQHLGLTWKGFPLGTLARCFGAVSGLDPYAIPAGLTIDIKTISWFAVVPPVLGAVGFLWLLGLAWIRGGSAIRLLIVASVIPLGVGLLMGRLFFLPQTPKYPVAPHGLALVAVVAGCWPRWRSVPWVGWFRGSTGLMARGIAVAFGLAVALAFALRYPAIYLPEYDVKTAWVVLSQRAKPEDCVVTLAGLTFPLPTSLYHVAFNVYLDQDPETGMFSGPDERRAREIAERLHACQRVWSLEFAGEHETFRGNERLRVWLVQSGYHEGEVKRLHRLRLTLFVRPTASR